MHIRPSELTLSELDPTVNFIPTQPLKLFRIDGPLSAYAVTKLDPETVPPPEGSTVVESLAVSLLVLVSPPPDTTAVVIRGDDALLATPTVSVSG